MNSEERRLRTFRNWPANAIVDFKRIAKAGFYYTGRDLEVQCFSCGSKISDWNYGDKVMTKHIALDPRCPFVRNPAESGNVPVENTTVSSSSVSENDNPAIPVRLTHREPVIPQPRYSATAYQHSESARLESFENWPKPYIVTPESLARAGFYYTNHSDKVKCAFCGGVVSHWESGDDPEEEHERHFPDCTYIQALSSYHQEFLAVPEPGPEGITLRCQPSPGRDNETTMRELNVQSHRTPKHPKYSMYEARLQTYTSWPGDVTQTPVELSESGFYYAGSGDQVRCFHCDGGLRMWDPNDDPWVEHARWFPHCGFIILVKGQSFVDEALALHPPLDESEIEELERVSIPKMNDHVVPSRSRVPVSDAQLQDLMSSPAATAALQMGLEISRVKVALRQRVASGGLPFESAEALINAALDVQLEEDSETWGTPPNTPVPMGFTGRRDSPQEDSTEEDTEPDDDSKKKAIACKRCPSSEINRRLSNGDSPDSADQQSTIKSILSMFSRESSKSPETPEEERKALSLLEEENRRLKEARLCKICMDKEISIVFLPCGHLVTCVQCAHSLADCPVCRKQIKATVRTFLS